MRSDMQRELTRFVMRKAEASGVWVPIAQDANTMRAVFEPVATRPVWTGACEATLYGDPAGNIAFRKWHDSKHVATGRGYDLHSELYVSELQLAEVPEALYLALRADTVGQQEYFYRHGAFPVDQQGFAEAYMRAGRLPAGTL